LAATPLDHSGGERFTLTAGLPTLGAADWSQALRALAACEGILYTDGYGTGTTDTTDT
jgi:hypothetical protein